MRTRSLLERIRRRSTNCRPEGGGDGPAEGTAASDDGPGTTDIAGEEELFGLQLELAKKYSLSVIVHSRDAFDATLGCIRNASYDAGVIHCFSYGKDEARAFLDRGLVHIVFRETLPGQKKRRTANASPLWFAIFRATGFCLKPTPRTSRPAPHRGKTNTPLLIEHTYARAAEILGLDVASLAVLVDANARELFSLK